MVADVGPIQCNLLPATGIDRYVHRDVFGGTNGGAIMGTKMRNTGIVVAALVVSITSGLLLGFGLWRTATKIEDNRSCWQSNSLGLERMAGEVQAMLQRLSRTQSQGDRERLIKDIGQDRDRLWTRVTHEDDLISQRLGWMLTIQAFLFAAFGVTVGKEAQESFRRFVTPTVCVFGWVSCLSIGYMLAVGRGVLNVLHNILGDQPRCGGMWADFLLPWRFLPPFVFAVWSFLFVILVF